MTIYGIHVIDQDPHGRIMWYRILAERNRAHTELGRGRMVTRRIVTDQAWAWWIRLVESQYGIDSPSDGPSHEYIA